ncbi:MAG: restriction endonuclease [Ignavibacteriae bacterium]|nr:restriction endonuclease [Ignavibacteria bacterium]MBI3363620.1 restriction endonuclease [Ignavibacteriota bacterium]
MAIPDYQSLMLPLLKLTSDKQEHAMRDVVERLASQFNLTSEERKELLPSGQQPIFDNRVAWAKTYLKKAGLLDAPRRALIVITERGLDVLGNNPSEINVRFLKQFPEFIEFQTAKREDETEGANQEDVAIQTPEESLELAYQRIRKALAQEVLNKVIQLPAAFFERLVVELLVRMGYGGSIKDAGKAIGGSGDEGIDGTIKEDKLGLDIIYIQAKRWQPGNLVGRPEIQKFVGALAGQGAKKGIFITTSSFTRDALDYVPRNETKIVLIDGEQLAQLMIDHNLGVAPQIAYEIKRLDNDYFGEE